MIIFYYYYYVIVDNRLYRSRIYLYGSHARRPSY